MDESMQSINIKINTCFWKCSSYWMDESTQSIKRWSKLCFWKCSSCWTFLFLPGVPNTVAIPTVQYEWLGNRKNLILRNSPFILFWAYIIHKYQGKTLDIAIIDLGTSEKCSGMKLVALSCVSKLSNLKIHTIPLWIFQKVNRSKIFSIIQDAHT